MVHATQSRAASIARAISVACPLETGMPMTGVSTGPARDMVATETSDTLIATPSCDQVCSDCQLRL
ncbi:hypothetical protein FGF80_17280 [Natrinema pallidum]|uniref:Uncharacterized protein n=1 Tax=Natrinema pallidum TaxID=69527 RepID=A0A4P9TL41_9EURY|nr:hypothetical protein FGF80_17280 [Natrinema pallidum]